MTKVTDRARQQIAAHLRESADQAEAEAAEADVRHAAAPPWSAAATIAPAARRRAADARLQADHVEAGTWLDYLESIGRGVRGG